MLFLHWVMFNERPTIIVKNWIDRIKPQVVNKFSSKRSNMFYICIEHVTESKLRIFQVYNCINIRSTAKWCIICIKFLFLSPVPCLKVTSWTTMAYTTLFWSRAQRTFFSTCYFKPILIFTTLYTNSSKNLWKLGAVPSKSAWNCFRFYFLCVPLGLLRYYFSIIDIKKPLLGGAFHISYAIIMWRLVSNADPFLCSKDK